MFWMCCSIKAANVQQIQIISADYMQTNMVRYECARTSSASSLGWLSVARGVGAWCEYMGVHGSISWEHMVGVWWGAEHSSTRQPSGYERTQGLSYTPRLLPWG